tara:strand:+ start:755 stop:991 length:237 start_codon:yes stop_codon:yes gene_type:complete
MCSSGDLVLVNAKITNVHKFDLLAPETTVYVVILRSKLIYKGTQNYDMPMVTSIFREIDKQWKIAFMQRSLGRSDLTF